MFARATRSKLRSESSALDLIVLTKVFPRFIADCSRDIDLEQDFRHS